MSRTARPLLVAGLALAAGLTLATPSTSASAPDERRDRGTLSRIALPDGFQPEGIATGKRRAWFGSRADGDIYRANLTTGKGKRISQGPGTPSLGLEIRRKQLFIAGGAGGDARVIDKRSGRELASYQLVESGDSFINDVIITRGSAWFTDSMNAQLFRIPLGRKGALPAPRRVERVALRGQWEQLPELNANGITATPDRRALLVVNSASGRLYRVNPRTGRARVVDLDGAELTNGDGLLLEGRTLYAVQNRLNQVAALVLNRSGSRGRLDFTFSTPRFDVPTTIARARGGLYLPNARFSTPPEPDTTYSAIRVPLRQVR